MANILVVEDEKPINDLITMNLKLIGHKFKKAFNSDEAILLLEKESFELVLLDVMIPGISGFDLMKYIKPFKIPVIFITAKDSLADKIEGFNLGAEDYLIKPFEILELFARINVALRHSNKHNNQKFILDSTEIRLDERTAFVNNKPIKITSREFSLLEVLILNCNIALSREKLLELAWGFDYLGETRTVDVHILKLRKKLEWENRIKTVYKLGYRLEAPQ